MKQHSAFLWRVSLVLIILVSAWQGATWPARNTASAAVSRLAASALRHGITLAVSPAAIPPGVPSQITISVKDSSGKPLVGAVISFAGVRTVAGKRTMGTQPLVLRIMPSGMQPVTITVRHAGYATISGQMKVAAPPVPALVSALRPSLRVVARGVTLSHPASLREALQFQWRAVAGPNDRGSLTFADGSVLDLDHNTSVLIKEPSRTFLQTGQVFLQVVSGGQSHDIETGSAVAASLGTRYMVRSVQGKTTVTVLSGRVTVVNGGKSVSIGSNQQSSLQGHLPPSAPARVNAPALVAWTSSLPVVPDAGLAHIAYLLLDQGNTLATFSIDSQQVVRRDHLPVPGVLMAVGRENDVLSIATRQGIVVVPLHGGKIRILDTGINAADVAALPNHQLAVADAGTNRVVVLDVSNGALVRSIALGYAPTAIAAAMDGQTAVVVGTGEVSLVDLTHGSLLTTRDVTGQVEQPAIGPDGSLAYALLPRTGQLIVLSLAARGIIGTVNLNAGGTVAPAASGSAVVGPDGRIYVLDPFTSAIDVLDPSTNTIVARYTLPAQPLSMSLTQDGKLMLVTAHPAGTLIVDPTGGAILTQAGIAGVSGPQALPPPVSVSHVGGPGAGTSAPGVNTIVVSSVPAVEAVQTQPQQFQATSTAAPTVTITATATITSTAPVTATTTITSTATVTATTTITSTTTPSPSSTATPSATVSGTVTSIGTATPTITTTTTITATSTPTYVALPGPHITLPHGPLFGAVEASAQPAIAGSLGVQWTRIPFIWSYVQQTGPASWNPFVLAATGSDGVINNEIAHGRSVAGLLLGSPAWAAKYPSFGRASVPINLDQPWNPPASDNPTTQKSWPANTNYWANYCYWMARHYAGRIDYWIIWNEPSIPTALNGAAGQWTQWYAGRTLAESVHAYVQLLEVASRAIHAANPNAKIVLSGDPYWYDKGAFLSSVLAQLHADDPANAQHGFFDVTALNLYIDSSTFYWIVGDVRRNLARYGWGNKPIWISETNVEPYDDPSHRTGPTQYRVTMDEQAGFLVDAFAVSIAAGASRIEVYRMFDGPETAHGLPPMGIVSNRLDPKTGQHWVRPIGSTFAFLVKLFKDTTGGNYSKGELYPAPLIGGKAGVFQVVINKPGARITVLWNRLGAHPTYTPPYARIGGVTYDAHDLIVLPLRDPEGVSYDRFATATYNLPAHATTATIYDKFGNAATLHEGQTLTINNRDENGMVKPEAHQTTISLSHGMYIVQLRGGVTYSDPADPRLPTVGGDPVIIVEATSSAQ